MQFVFHLGLVLVLFTSFAAQAGIAEQKPIRLRLSAHKQKIQIQGLGLAISGLDSPIIPVAIPQTESLEIQRKCDENKKCFWSIERARGSQKTQKFSFENNLLIQGSQITSGEHPWPRRLLLSLQSPQYFDILSQIPMDQYLTGVLASEMPLHWPEEALKAQAIVARSYLLAVQRERASQKFDVETSVQDQVFEEVLDHRPNDPKILHALEVVQATAGQVLLDSKSKVIKTFYHSDCGGQTESAENVWKNSSQTVVVKDKYCQSRWHFRISKSALFNKLKTKLSDFQWSKDLSELTLRTDQTPQSFRVASLLIKGLGKSLKVPAPLFREIVGYSQIKSTSFAVQEQGDELVFEGQGYGHGVGLCQWGSRAWAQHGWKMPQILAHYFPQSRLGLITR